MENERKKIAQRLKEARVTSGFKTAKSFIDQFGLSQSTYSLHETGQRAIGSQAAILYCKHLNINIDWLLTGDGINPLQSDTIEDFNPNTDLSSNDEDGQRLSEAELKQMTLTTKAKRRDLIVKQVDHELLSIITREILQLYSKDATYSLEIARAISGIYSNIEEISEDDTGKRLLIKPLINAYKMGFSRSDELEPELKVSNLG